MIGGDAAAEDALHALDELRREGDLGNQQQYVAAPRQHLGDQVDVDFGLARPGDALQQGRGLSGGELSAQGFQRRLLVRRQLRKAEDRAAALDRTFAPGADDVFLAPEGVQHGMIGPEQTAGHLARRNARLIAGRGQFEQRFVLFRGAPFDFLADFVKTALVAEFRGQRHVTLGTGTELVVGELLLRVARGLHQGGQRHAHHLPQGAHVVRGDPLPQGHLLRREQPHAAVKHAGDGFDGPEIGTAVMHPPHDPRIDPSAAELHRHGLAPGDGHAFRQGERVGGLRQRKNYVGIAGHQGLLMAWNPLP